MSTRSLFEVHTLKGSQWVIDSTYPDRDSAIEVAKQLYGEKRFDGVKVIKDTFDPKTGDAKEIVVFDTASKKRDKPSLQPTEEPSAAAPAPSFAPDSKKKEKGPNKDISVALKAVGWLILILIVAAGLIFLVRYAGHMIY